MAVGPQFMVVSIFVLDTSCITNGGFNKGLTLRPNFPFANKLKTQCPLATCLGTWIWTFGGAQWKTLPRQIVRCIWVSTMEENRAWWKTGDEKCWACVRVACVKKTNKVNPCCLAFKTILICSKWNRLCLIPPAYSRCVMVQAFLVFFALFLQKTSPCIPPTPTKKVWTSGRWGRVETRDEITQNLRKIGLWLWFLNDYRCKSHIFLIFSDWICLNSCQVWSPAMIWGCVNMGDHTGPWQPCTSEVLLLAGSRPFGRLGGWLVA